MAKKSGAIDLMRHERAQFTRLRSLSPDRRAQRVAAIRERQSRAPINTSTMFVRVVEPPRIAGAPGRRGLHAFYQVQDLRRECMRVWPGAGVLIDCFAEITAREPEASLARRIELSDLMSRTAAARIRQRLTDTTRGNRIDLRVMHRLDVWAENCAVYAKFLSDEEYAYWCWRFDHPRKYGSVVEVNAAYPKLPAPGYSRQKAQSRLDPTPEPPKPEDIAIHHLTLDPTDAQRADWAAEFDDVWRQRAELPETENPVRWAADKVIESRKARVAAEAGATADVEAGRKRVVAKAAVPSNPIRIMAGELTQDFEVVEVRRPTEADRSIIEGLLADADPDDPDELDGLGDGDGDGFDDPDADVGLPSTDDDFDFRSP